MQVRLFSGATKRRNSTRLPEGGTVWPCVLKDRSSVLNPTIALKWRDDQYYFDNPENYNMAYIPEYQRYYWIDNWTFEDRQWIASMSVDVLASHRTPISTRTKYIVRADVDDMSEMLVDNKYPALTAPYTDIRTTTGSGPLWTNDINSGSIIVSAIGDSPSYSTAGLSYFYMTASEFNKMIRECFTESLNVWSQTQTLGQNLGEVFQAFGENWLRTLNDPFQYIKSAMWFPFAVPHSATASTIRLGLINTGAVGYPISSATVTQSWTATLPQTLANIDMWERYQYAAPYLTAKIKFMPFGIVPIDTSVTLRQSGKVYMQTISDLVSGIGRLDVYAGTSSQSDYPLASVSAQVGVPLAIASSNINYLDALRNIAGGASEVAVAASNPVPQNIIGAAAAVGNAIASLTPQVSSTGQSGGISGFDSSPHIHVLQYSFPPENSTEFGRPLCESRMIGSISGFVQCADPEIEIEGAYAEELDMIGQFLTGGFYYE